MMTNTQLLKEDIEPAKTLYNTIVNHKFNKKQTKKLLDEYDEYIEDIHRLLDYPNHYNLDKHVYEYKYFRYINIPTEFVDKSTGDIIQSHKHVEIWSIPNVGILESAMHDYRHIKSTMKFRWDDEKERERLLNLYKITCEKILYVFSELINGRYVTKMEFPIENPWSRLGPNKVFEYVQNPKYDLDWTLISEM